LFYLRFSVDLPIIYSQNSPTGAYNVDNQLTTVPGATIGLEIQTFDLMSAAFNFEMRFADVGGYTFIPGIGFQLKFPLRVERHFMMKPYIAASYSWNTASWSSPGNAVSFPGLAWGGGFQFAFRGAAIGAWFFRCKLYAPI